MDHKLAIVIVPRNSNDPIEASRALLERFQKVPLGATPGCFEQKFRYKRVGGWFDGLVNGDVGQERWSVVLRMLLEGKATNAMSPFPGYGTETGAEIESRIEADNTINLDDIWPLAPSSVIVTPDGDWIAHPDPDSLDQPASADVDNLREVVDGAWAATKRALFWEHRGATAVAWDLSWHFIGRPIERKKPRKARVWGSRKRPKGNSNPPAPFGAAVAGDTVTGLGAVALQNEVRADSAALDRWARSGGVSSGSGALRLTRTMNSTTLGLRAEKVA